MFNRRWVAGSDDFVIPFGIAFVLRLIWYVSQVIRFQICDYSDFHVMQYILVDFIP